jgi:membrane protein DedA with SNARE-associated domain
MRVHLFMLAIIFGRILRFGIISFLVIRYGQKIVDKFGLAFRQNAPLLFGILAVLAVVVFVIWRWRRSVAIKADR